jgi:hypothetical protein
MAMITRDDIDNYGSELIDMSRRAAMEALAPDLHRLGAENQQLRAMAQRAQHGEIQRTLDAQVPGWHEIYQDPRFSQWLAMPDDYSGAVRSQLLRDAVAKGDAARIAAIYRGFQQEAGQPQYRSRGSGARSSATGNKPNYTREQIRQIYAQRARGAISDARWAQIEPDIIAAASEGRINSVFDKYGNETRFR